MNSQNQTRHFIDPVRCMHVLALHLHLGANLDDVGKLAHSVDVEGKMAVEQPIPWPLSNESYCHRTTNGNQSRVGLTDCRVRQRGIGQECPRSLCLEVKTVEMHWMRRSTRIDHPPAHRVALAERKALGVRPGFSVEDGDLARMRSQSGSAVLVFTE